MNDRTTLPARLENECDAASDSSAATRVATFGSQQITIQTVHVHSAVFFVNVSPETDLSDLMDAIKGKMPSPPPPATRALQPAPRPLEEVAIEGKMPSPPPATRASEPVANPLDEVATDGKMPSPPART